jgi:N6-L-threonylcarbamoyladenine synthase
VRHDLPRPLVLGVETSCDETSAAVLDGRNHLLGHVILSQDVHEVFGGVVPELAARAHLQRIDAVVHEALEKSGVSLGQVDVFGVTAGPGLIGALLVGRLLDQGDGLRPGQAGGGRPPHGGAPVRAGAGEP